MSNLFAGWYIIKNGEVIPAPNEDEWMLFWDRVVWQTRTDDVLVSTVFLGFDHGFSYQRYTDPILYETMVFADGGTYEQWNEVQNRYATREAALHGHRTLLNQMGIQDDSPGFEHPAIEIQISRLQLLMED